MNRHKQLFQTVIAITMLWLFIFTPVQALPQTNSPTPTTENEKKEQKEVKLIMVGDILLHTPVEESCKLEDGNYDFHSVFAHVKKEVSAADLALVNEEVIIGGEELGVSGYPAFNAPYSIGDALVDTGFDVVLHATNHSLDKGTKGIKNCLTFWKNNYPDISVLGIHESAEDAQYICVRTVNGIRIAILNYTYGTNGIQMPADMLGAVNLLEEKKVTADIEKAKSLADFIIVCPHWGIEYSLKKSKEQEYWTKIFLENGVDLVLGTHPHVIEPIEWVQDEKTGRKMLVYYSLGNFVNWTSGTGIGVANRMVGGMAQITIGKDETGKAVIKNYGVKELVCHVQKGQGGVSTYFLSDYTGEMALKNEITKQDSTFSKEYCEKLCDSVW